MKNSPKFFIYRTIFFTLVLLVFAILKFFEVKAPTIEEKNNGGNFVSTSSPITEPSIAEQLRDCMPRSDSGSHERCTALLAQIQEFYQCVQAGFPIEKSNPPLCKTPDGRVFTEDPQKVTTLTGLHVCLPQKDNEGPATLECALGLRTDDGSYYALDMTVLQNHNAFFPTGTRLKVSGLLTPAEMLNTDHWQKYGIKGILKVTDAEEIN